MTTPRRRPIPAWRQRQIAEREAERDARRPVRTVLVGLGTQDPDAVAEWSRSLVRALYRQGQWFCLDCERQAGANPIAMQTEGETLCGSCGHRLDEAQALRRTA